MAEPINTAEKTTSLAAATHGGRSQNATTEPMELIEPASETEEQYISGHKLVLLVVAVCSALIVVSMDSTILTTAVPKITNDFHTISDIAWYSSAYRLTSCSFQFAYGKVYAVYSVKRTFIVANVILLVGSFVSGIAPNSKIFILGRAICGLGQAGIYAGCFTLTRHFIPLRRRSIFNSIGAAVEGLSEIGAPLLGGILTDALSWRWCFYINLPIGAITILIVAFFLPSIPSPPEIADLNWKAKLLKIDLLGTIVFVPAISCLLLALQWAGTKYGWGSTHIIALLVVFGILLALFSWYQHKRQESAVLPPRILKQRTILASAWFIFCTNSSISVITYYMPIYFQSVRGFSATKSGLLILPIIIGFIIAALFAGITTSVVGYYSIFAVTTSVLLPVSTGLITTLKADANIVKIMGFQAFFGLAAGLGFQTPQIASQTVLNKQDAAIGSSIILFAQALGPAIFNAAALNIFETKLTQNLHYAIPTADVAQLESMGLSDIRSHANETGTLTAAQLTKILSSYDKSLTQTFILPTVLASLLVIGALSMEWRSVKQKRS